MADESEKWFMIIAGERDGPFTTQDIQDLIDRKQVSVNTMIWHKDMRDWMPLREVETFRLKPPPEPEPEEPPKPDEGERKSRRRPFFFKLGALLAGLGLAAGGVYWGFYQPSEEDLQPQPVQARVQNLVHQLTTGETPQAEQAHIEMGSQAVSPLLKALPADPFSPIGERIRHVLVAIGPPAVTPLSAYFQRQMPAGRVLIIQVLGDIGGLRVVPALIQMLNDPNLAVQNQAVEALGKLDANTVPVLINHLTSPIHNPTPQTRKNLARALAQYADPFGAGFGA